MPEKRVQAFTVCRVKGRPYPGPMPGTLCNDRACHAISRIPRKTCPNVHASETKLVTVNAGQYKVHKFILMYFEGQLKPNHEHHGCCACHGHAINSLSNLFNKNISPR